MFSVSLPFVYMKKLRVSKCSFDKKNTPKLLVRVIFLRLDFVSDINKQCARASHEYLLT